MASCGFGLPHFSHQIGTPGAAHGQRRHRASLGDAGVDAHRGQGAPRRPGSPVQRPFFGWFVFKQMALV